MNYELEKSAKHICPNLEEFRRDEPYAFTLSPSRELGTSRDYKTSLNIWLKKVRDELSECDHCDFSKLYVELSKTGRPHLHGYITVFDLVGFYCIDLRVLQSIGTYCIRPIGNSDETREQVESSNKWEEYISKQNPFIAGCFKGLYSYPLEIDNKNKIREKQFDRVKDVEKDIRQSNLYHLKHCIKKGCTECAGIRLFGEDNKFK